MSKVKFKGEDYFEITEAFVDLAETVTEEYAKWDEGQKVDWDAVASKCGTMLAVFGDDIEGKEEQDYRDRERNNEQVYDDEAAEERKDNISLQENDRSKWDIDYMDMSVDERIALLVRDRNPFDETDEIVDVDVDSVWEYDTATDKGPDRDEARAFTKMVWERYGIVAVYYGDKTYDNLRFYGYASDIYEFMVEEEWYGTGGDEVVELHPELAGSWGI